MNKMHKKGLAVFLVFVMLVGAFAACGNNTTNGHVPLPDVNPLEDFQLEDIIFEVEGASPITWGEILYELTAIRFMLEEVRPLDQWDELFEQQVFAEIEEYMNFNQIALHYAREAALERRAVVHVFESLGLTLEADYFDLLIADYFEQFDTNEEELAEELAHAHLSMDVFRFINEVAEMQERLWPALNETISDADIDSFAAEEGILRAMHILVIGDDQETTDQAMAIYEELSQLEGDALLERFEELLAAYGEDPGMLQHTQGYTFAPGVMVPEFYDGTFALAYYEVSPPVRSDFGYHIILRLPIDRTLVAMFGQQQLPLEQFLVGSSMEEQITAARRAFAVTSTPLFDYLIPSDIFATLTEMALATQEED